MRRPHDLLTRMQLRNPNQIELLLVIDFHTTNQIELLLVIDFMRQTFRYDVFMSFRGFDTRKNFTSHLYEALRRHGFQVFHDTSLSRGEGIAPQLSEAIKESKIYVVVFSTHYANSKWCLDELSQMMHCVHTNARQQIVLPILLDVKQPDVGAQQGPFGELIKKFDQERVHKWREALQEVAQLPGLHLQDDANVDENELLEQIVDKIRKMLHEQQDPLHVVGIESQVQKVISSLNMGCDDVRVLVIRGPAGMGKTMIAKATYERLAIHYKAQHTCFLLDVKTVFGEINGKLTLQKRFMSNLVQNEESRIRIDNYHQGIGKIEKMIKNQKLLLVLDDVDNEEQLEILGMNRAVLGRGSRIIVTTRESNVVDRVKPYATYEPRLLDENESLEVFCLNAFGQEHPKEGYGDVAMKAVCWGAGCPGVLKGLALHMGQGLYQSVEEWGRGLRYAMQNPSCLDTSL